MKFAIGPRQGVIGSIVKRSPVAFLPAQTGCTSGQRADFQTHRGGRLLIVSVTRKPAGQFNPLRRLLLFCTEMSTTTYGQYGQAAIILSVAIGCAMSPCVLDQLSDIEPTPKSVWQPRQLPRKQHRDLRELCLSASNSCLRAYLTRCFRLLLDAGEGKDTEAFFVLGYTGTQRGGDPWQTTLSTGSVNDLKQ